VGASAADIRLATRITLESSHRAASAIDRMTPFSNALQHPVAKEYLQPVLDGMRQQFGDGEASETMMLFMSDTPIGKMAIMGVLTDQQLDDLIAAANTQDDIS
jgi:hypothetical protein